MMLSNKSRQVSNGKAICRRRRSRTLVRDVIYDAIAICSVGTCVRALASSAPDYQAGKWWAERRERYVTAPDDAVARDNARHRR